MFYVPEGFAHGFLTLDDETEFVYRCTDLYSPEYDSGILWSDKKLNIDWKFEEFGINPEELTISDKDQKQQEFNPDKNYFEQIKNRRLPQNLDNIKIIFINNS